MSAQSGSCAFFDAHCHLQDSRLALWLSEGGDERIRASGIRAIVVNGTHPEDWDRVASLANRYEFVKPSYGLHPWRVNDRTDGWEEALRQRVEAGGAAIGEIGLDRWIDDYDMDAQTSAFLYQYRLSRELDLPVSIHCLRAWGTLLELLEKEESPPRGFLLHSYGGPLEMVDSFAKLGARFSFSGYFARAASAKKRRAFEAAPMDRLLIETDAPDMLGPEETIAETVADDKGREINSPINLPKIYRYAANMRGMELEAFCAAIESNFKAFYE